MPVDCRKSTIVLDSAAMFAGVELSYGLFYTTEGVVREVLDSGSRMRLEFAQASGKLVVLSPPSEHVASIKSKARELGLLKELTQTDIEVLALAEYVKKKCGSVILYTDDKLVQDVALSLGIQVHGIKYVEKSRPSKYSYRCRSCGYAGTSPGVCPRCGSLLELEVFPR
ncbi:MAG: NOB1 family endonuclease [Sulfolobales archaeon]